MSPVSTKSARTSFRDAGFGPILIILGKGAASGFGLAITHLFASHGATVIAADLNKDELNRQFVSAERITTIVANVTRLDDWTTIASQAKQNYGRIDILINNAGTSYRNKVRWKIAPKKEPITCLGGTRVEVASIFCYRTLLAY